MKSIAILNCLPKRPALPMCDVSWHVAKPTQAMVGLNS
jgi:hypothetical protein